MKKQFIIALVASAVLVNGASVAFAAKVSDPDNSSSSTTVAARPNNDNRVATENRIADEKVARAAKVLEATNARNTIMATFKTAMAKAIKTKNTALSSAKTDAGRKAVKGAFNIAVAAVSQAKARALKALTTGQTTTTTTVKP